MVRDRSTHGRAQIIVDLAICVPYFAAAVLLEKLALRRGRGWRPHDTWPWALRLRRRAGRPWTEAT